MDPKATVETQTSRGISKKALVIVGALIVVVITELVIFLKLAG